MTSTTGPSEAKEMSRKSLELATLYSEVDPCSSMLHCRRSLEAVMHHLLNDKGATDSDLEFMAKKINFVRPENDWKYWHVNRVTSSWIHWNPEGTQGRIEVKKCIRIMREILEEVFGIESGANETGFSILDSFTRNLSEAIGVISLGRGV